MYALTATEYVLRLADQAQIPPDPENTDWQAYQAWLAAGNTPTPYAPPPAPAVPQSVTPVQAFSALDQAGLLGTLMAYIDAPTTPPLVRATALGATEWRRDSLLLMSVAIVLGLTGNQVDDLFKAAAAVQL